MARIDPEADRAYYKEYYRRHKKKVLDRRKKEYYADVEARRDKARRYYHANKDKAREYNRANQEKRRAYNREYARKVRSDAKLFKMCKDISEGKGIDDKTSWCLTWVDAMKHWFKRMGKEDKKDE